jgi:GTP-binding protein LepA
MKRVLIKKQSMNSSLIQFNTELIQSLAKMNILLNGNAVDPLAVLIHRSKVESYGREMVAKLKKLIDRYGDYYAGVYMIHREQFSIAIQACVGSKIVAREEYENFRF